MCRRADFFGVGAAVFGISGDAAVGTQGVAVVGYVVAQVAGAMPVRVYCGRRWRPAPSTVLAIGASLTVIHLVGITGTCSC